MHTAPAQVYFVHFFILLKPLDLDSLQAEELHTLLMRSYDKCLTPVLSFYLQSVCVFARNTDHGSSFSSAVPSNSLYSLPSDHYQFSSRRVRDSGPICSHGGAETHGFLLFLYQPWRTCEEKKCPCLFFPPL